MSDTECENLINFSLDENCDTGLKTTKNMLKLVNNCMSVGKQFFSPLRRGNKGNRFEENFFDFEEQQQAEVGGDPFEMMEKEAQLKARQLSKNLFEENSSTDIVSNLSFHGLSLSSPSRVSNDLKVESTVKLFSSLQFNESHLSAESPLKFVDDDIMSEEEAKSKNAEKLFQADLEKLKIPILDELDAVEKRKFIENEDGTIGERASTICNGLTSLNALKAKLQFKSKEIPKISQTDANRRSIQMTNDVAFDFVTALDANLDSEDPKQPKNRSVSPSPVWNKKRSDFRTSTRVSGLLPYSTNVNPTTNSSKVATSGRTQHIEKPLPEQAAIKPAYISKNVISNSGLRQKSLLNEKSITASMTSLKCTLRIKTIAETPCRSLRPEIAQSSSQVKTRRSPLLKVKPTHNRVSIRTKDSSKLKRSPGKNAPLKNSSSKELARGLRGDSTLCKHSSIRGSKSNFKHYSSKLKMDEGMDECSARTPVQCTLASKDVTPKTGSHIGPRTSTIRSTSEFKTKSSLKPKINGKNFNAAAAISAESSKLTSRLSMGAPNNRTKPNKTAKPRKYGTSMFRTSLSRNKENNRP